MTHGNRRLPAGWRNVLAQLPYLPRQLRLIWEAGRGWTIAWLVLLVAQGILPAATVILTRSLVNQLVAAINAHGDWQASRSALVLAGLMGALMLLGELLRVASGWVRTGQAERVQDHITALIHAKSAEVDLAFYEMADYYDRLYRAREDASYRPIALLEASGSLVQNVITLLAMAAILLSYGPWLPAILLLSTIPAVYVVLHYALREHVWHLRVTPDQRLTSYYDWLLTASHLAAEVRIFGLAREFQSAYQGLRRRLRTERLDLAGQQALAELFAAVIGLLLTFGAFAFMAWRTLLGFVTLGDLALFYQAFNQGQELMRSLLRNVGQVYSNSLFLGDLFEFLALQPQLVQPDQPLPMPYTEAVGAGEPGGLSVCFHMVTFRYPGSQSPALQNFELEIPAGQVVAIVGPNGAGKSTLLKLLARLYDPQSGGVKIGGTDIRDLRTEDLRALLAVLCQDPVRYNTTMRRNIGLGDLDSKPNLVKIATAIETAGAEDLLFRLPQGYDTLLGKWFVDGTELSGGEWQRLALARAFVRQAPIIVLDEPTSAMDPWAEAEWFDRFRAQTPGRTVIIVTHRITTAMRADAIHVLEAGQVLESGTHAELLARKGRYWAAWQAQGRAGFEGETFSFAMPPAAVTQNGHQH